MTTEQVQGRNRWLIVLDRIVGVVCFSGLVLPVSLLLFLQWPLRELVHAWSRDTLALLNAFSTGSGSGYST